MLLQSDGPHFFHLPTTRLQSNQIRHPISPSKVMAKLFKIKCISINKLCFNNCNNGNHKWMIALNLIFPFWIYQESKILFLKEKSTITTHSITQLQLKNVENNCLLCSFVDRLCVGRIKNRDHEGGIN